MQITLFTSNDLRHNYLIDMLSSISKKLFVIKEIKLNSKKLELHTNLLYQKYFEDVNQAQTKVFKKDFQRKNNVKIYEIDHSTINQISKKNFTEFFDSDYYIVFGSSYIKNELLELLIKNKTINIHAGVSPYYRGTDCNFWALYDNNPHLVGATVHYLSKGLDDGPILFHAMSKKKNNPHIYTMSTLKSAFLCLKTLIENNKLFDIKILKQNKKKQIRYTKKINFNNFVLTNYYDKKIDLNSKKFKYSLLKDPFFL